MNNTDRITKLEKTLEKLVVALEKNGFISSHILEDTSLQRKRDDENEELEPEFKKIETKSSVKF